MAYVLAIESQLKSPTNLVSFANDIQSKIGGIKANINLDSGSAVSGLSKLNTNLTATQSTLRAIQSQSVAFNGSLASLANNANSGASAMSKFGESAGLAARRFLAFTVAAGSFLKFVQVVRDGIKEAVDFQLEMNRLAQVSGYTDAQIAKVQQNITGLATSLGVSSKELAKVNIQLEQAGIRGKQAAEVLEAVALTDLAPNFENMTQTTDGLIAAMAQFKIASVDTKTALGGLNQVAGDFAVESKDLITAIQKAGAAFASTSGAFKAPTDSLNEFIGLFTSVRATTRESAETIATGLRTVFTRFQRAETVQALKDLRIELRYTADEAKALGDNSLTNQFVGAFEATKRLSQGLKGLRETDPRFSQVLEQLGGYRQINRVLPLLREFEVSQKAVSAAQAGSLSLTIAQEKRQEALANKVAKVGEEYAALFRNIAGSNQFQSLADAGLKFASALSTVLEFARPLVPILTTLAAIKFAQSIGPSIVGFASNFAAPVPAAQKRRGFATGGMVGVVPGFGNTDSVKADLMPGEFVIKKHSAQQIGYEKLNEANENPNKFANGGPIVRSKFYSATPGQSKRGVQNEDIQNVSDLIFKKTGINVNKLANIATYENSNILPSKYKQVLLNSLGFYSPDSYEVAVNQNNISRANLSKLGVGSRKELFSRVMSHEIGHSLDDSLASNPNLFLSDESLAVKFLGRSRFGNIDASQRVGYTESQKPNEGFADLFSDYIFGNNKKYFRGISDKPDLKFFESFILPMAERQGLTGFATGGLVKYPPQQRATVRELLNSISDRSGSKYEAANARSILLDSLKGKGALSTIPKGSRYLGSGAVGLALKTPADDVVRLQSDLTVDDILGTIQKPETKARFAQALSADRPDIDYVLQASGKGQFGKTTVERLPFAPSLESLSGLTNEDRSSMLNKLRVLIRQQGYTFADDHLGNVGLYNGEPTVIDPGAVRKLTASPFEKTKQLVGFASGGPAKRPGKGKKKNWWEDADLDNQEIDSVDRDLLAAAQFDIGEFDAALSPAGLESYRKLRGDINARKIPRKFAFGGSTGSDPSDRIPALLTPGEFVFSRDAAAAIGDGNLRYMNATGKVPGYAEGGRVGFANGDSVLPDLSKFSLDKIKMFETLTKPGPKGGANVIERMVAAFQKKFNASGAEDLEGTATEAAIRAIDKFDDTKEGANAQGFIRTSINRALVSAVRKSKTTSLNAIVDAEGKSFDVRDPASSRGGSTSETEAERAEARAARVAEFKAKNQRLLESVGTGKYADIQGVAKSLGVENLIGKTDVLIKSIAEVASGAVAAKRVDSGVASAPVVAGAGGGNKPPRPPVNVAGAADDRYEPRRGRTPKPGDGDFTGPLPESFFYQHHTGRQFVGPRYQETKFQTKRLKNPTNLVGTGVEDLLYPPQLFPGLTYEGKYPEEARYQNTILGLNAQRKYDRDKADRRVPPTTGAGIDAIISSRVPGSFGKTLTPKQRNFLSYDKFRTDVLAEGQKNFFNKPRASELQRRRDEEFEASIRRLDEQEEAKKSLAGQKGRERRANNRGYNDAYTYTQVLTPESRDFPHYLNSTVLGGTESYSKYREGSVAARAKKGILPTTDPLEVKKLALEQLERYKVSGDYGDAPQFLEDVRRRLVPNGQLTPNEFHKLSPDDQKSYNAKLAQFKIIEKRFQSSRDNTYSATQGLVDSKTTGVLKGGFSASLVGRDAEGNVDATSGLIGLRADKAFEKQLSGRSFTSDANKASLANYQLATTGKNIQAELYSAQYRLLEATNKNANAYQLASQAATDTAKAMQGRAKVSVSSGGDILGLTDTVQSARAAGIDAPGAGGLGYRAGQIYRNATSGIASFLGNGANKLAGSRLNRGLANLNPGIAPYFVAPAIAGYLDSAAGDATTAIAGGATSSFSNLKGGSGAIQGGLVGGAIGSAIGGPLAPLTGAIGIAVGGLVGFASSVREASREITDAKIGKSITTIGDNLSFLVNSAQDKPIDPSYIASLAKSREELTAETDVKATDKATGLFGFGSFNIKTYSDSLRRLNRDQLGPQLTNLSTFINQQAANAGRVNPNGDVGQILSGILGKGSFNERTVKDVAELRGIKTADVEKELRKSILSGQNAIKSERRNAEGARAEEQAINTFGRFIQSLQAAGDTLDKFKNQTDTINALFDGTVSASKFDIGINKVGQLGRPDNKALTAFDSIVASVGPQASGLRKAAGVSNDIEKVLPTILASVAGRRFEGENPAEDFTTAVETQLKQALGGSTNLSADTSSAISSILARLNEETKKGTGKLSQEIGTDVTAYTANLLAPLSDPVKKAGLEAGKIINDAGQTLEAALINIANKTRQAEELIGQKDQLSLQELRYTTQFKAEAEGRRSQGVLSLADLNRPFDERQRRLGGANAFNPAALGKELIDLQGKIPQAEARRDAIGRTIGIDKPQFLQAKQELVNLKDRSRAVTEALRHLQDVTAKVAAAEEQLARVRKEKDARESIGLFTKTGSPEELLEFNRGIVLANEANNRLQRGDANPLAGFSNEQMKSLFSALQRFQGADLPGFVNNPNSTDLAGRLSAIGFPLPDNLKKKDAEAKDQITGALGTAKGATDALSAAQASNIDKLTNNLQSLQANFFSQLISLLRQNEITKAQNQVGQETVNVNRLTGLGESAKVLSQVGITSDQQLKAFQIANSEVSAYVSAKQNVADTQSTFNKADAGIRDIAKDLVASSEASGVSTVFLGANAKKQKELREKFIGAGLPIDDADALVNKVSGRIIDNDKLPGFLQDQLNPLRNSKVAKAVEQEEKAAKDLKNKGIDPSQLGQFVGSSPEAFANLQKAIEAISKSPEKLDGLATATTNAQKALQAFTAQLNDLKQQQRVAEVAAVQAEIPFAFARGGVVRARGFDKGGLAFFDPKGVDNIPAMLAQGEFVVRAEEAKKHRKVLEAINSGKFSAGTGLGFSLPYSRDKEKDLDAGYSRQIQSFALPARGFASGGFVEPSEEEVQRILAEKKAKRAEYEAKRDQLNSLRNDGLSKQEEDNIFGERPSLVKALAPDEQRDRAQKTARAYYDEKAKANTTALLSALPNDLNNNKLFFNPSDSGLGISFGKNFKNPDIAEPSVGSKVADAELAARKEARRLKDEQLAQIRFQRDFARGRASAGQVQTDALQDELKFQAASNPFSFSAQQIATNRNPKQAANIAGRFNFAADVRSLRQRQILGQSEAFGAGLETQRDIAQAGIARQQEVRNRARLKDFNYEEFLRSRRQNQIIKLGIPAYAEGGPVTGTGIADNQLILARAGEFVLNPGAVNRFGGLSKVAKFNDGGPVGFAGQVASTAVRAASQVANTAANSGSKAVSIAGSDDLARAMTQFAQAATSYASSSTALAQAFVKFATDASSLAQALSNFPRSVTFTGQWNGNLTINGAEVLTKLMPEMQKMVADGVKAKLSEVFKAQMPEAGLVV